MKNQISKVLLFVAAMSLTSVLATNAQAQIQGDGVSVKCVATDVGVAHGAINTSGNGRVLFSGVLTSSRLVIKARLGTGTYFVRAIDNELFIISGAIESVGVGSLRILDLKNGVGLKCGVN